MKKIINLFLVCLMLINCSDETTNQEQSKNQFPVIEAPNITTANIGEVIKLLGTFDPSESYKIAINDLECEITEIQPTFLTFKIPSQAESGTITMTYNNETKSITSITIASDPILGKWRLYLNQDGSQPSDCEKKSIFEVTSDGKYSKAVFYDETFEENGETQTGCNGSLEDKEYGTWTKNNDNTYTLKEDNDEESQSATITFSENFTIMKIDNIENAATWKRIESQFPVIETPNITTANIGEIIKLQGIFEPSEAYKIAINDLECEITEIQSTFLTFKIPSQAESGTITMTYNNETKSITNITITSDPILGKWRLYLNQDGSQPNDCEKKSIFEVTSDGRYSKAIFYDETFEENGETQSRCNGSLEDKEYGTWTKNNDNTYTLKEDNDEESQSATITFSENFTIMKIDNIENAATWRRIK